MAGTREDCLEELGILHLLPLDLPIQREQMKDVDFYQQKGIKLQIYHQIPEAMEWLKTQSC